MATSVFRCDQAPVNLLMCGEVFAPPVTRVGVFEYPDVAMIDGRPRRELRLPEEVFNPESLNSFYAKPLILFHPPDATKSTQKVIGTAMSPGARNGDWVHVNLALHDPEVRAIIDGKNPQGVQIDNLSAGYVCDYDETPGVWNGEPYDAIQRNIRYNHIALVETARAGPEARITMDGVQDMAQATGLETTPLVGVKLGHEIYQVQPAVHAHIGELQERVTRNDAQIAALTAGKRQRHDGALDEIRALLEQITPEDKAALKELMRPMFEAEAENAVIAVEDSPAMADMASGVYDSAKSLIEALIAKAVEEGDQALADEISRILAAGLPTEPATAEPAVTGDASCGRMDSAQKTLSLVEAAILRRQVLKRSPGLASNTAFQRADAKGLRVYRDIAASLGATASQTDANAAKVGAVTSTNAAAAAIQTATQVNDSQSSLGWVANRIK